MLWMTATGRLFTMPAKLVIGEARPLIHSSATTLPTGV